MTKTTHIHWTNTLLSGVLSRAHYDHSFTPSLTFWESSQPAPRRCGLPGLAETAWSPVSRCGLKQRNESFTDNFTGHTEVKWSNWNSSARLWLYDISYELWGVCLLMYKWMDGELSSFFIGHVGVTTVFVTDAPMQWDELLFHWYKSEQTSPQTW